MRNKEPKFMSELHKIREGLTKQWAKLSPKEIINSLRQDAKEIIRPKTTPRLHATR
ncbi:MAG: hypothetical protein WAX79_06985 [Candidatus Omnitrophota bacterium]